MDKNDKLYIVGHRGLVGSAIVRNLEKKGYNHLFICSCKELNLTNKTDKPVKTMKILMAHVKYLQAGGEDIVFENECELLRSAGIDLVPMVFSNEAINDSGIINKLKLGMNSVWSLPSYRRFPQTVTTTSTGCSSFSQHISTAFSKCL